MDQPYLPIHGDLVAPSDLALPKAQELARFLQSATNPFVRLLECRARSGEEVLVLEVDVEVPQRPTHDIRHTEQLATIFSQADQQQPEVLSLRPDFPSVPHLNLRSAEFPRSLCLYDRPYYEVKLHWTAPSFLERIREWLAQTAKGELHGEDQPLEPLMFDSALDFVIPDHLLSREWDGTPEWLAVKTVPRTSDVFTAIAVPWNGDAQDGPAFVAFVVSCLPQTHGVIRRTPGTVAELDEFTVTGGLHLVETLRTALKEWMQNRNHEFHRVLEARPIFIIRLPKTRTQGGEVETLEFRAFASSSPVKDVGIDVGVWELSKGEPGFLLESDETKRGAGTGLISFNTRVAFSRSQAARVNGTVMPVPVKITAVGVGALGSQVISNLVRAGFGEWTLVDHDLLLPHNLGRHALDGFALGLPKASALAQVLNATIYGDDIARSIVTDVLCPGQQAKALESAFSEAEIILDMSASVSVARHLSRDLGVSGRRISLFLNPSGTALTLLAEDAAHQISLDSLEMQLYRESAANPALNELLASSGDLRIGQSCRDVTVPIPQNLVALHAAIGSHAIRETLATKDARISVWQVELSTYTVSATHIDPVRPEQKQVGAWAILTDAGVSAKLSELRRQRLPKETGGVLIGAHDVGRRVIYLVDALPSPPDSEEYPTAYIRGSQGLAQSVRNISHSTDGMLHYIGEWHSHPPGSSIKPSPRDEKLLGWVGDIMYQDGLPGVMAVVGDEGRLATYLTGLAPT